MPRSADEAGDPPETRRTVRRSGGLVSVSSSFIKSHQVSSGLIRGVRRPPLDLSRILNCGSRAPRSTNPGDGAPRAPTIAPISDGRRPSDALARWSAARRGATPPRRSPCLSSTRPVRVREGSVPAPHVRASFRAGRGRRHHDATTRRIPPLTFVCFVPFVVPILLRRASAPFDRKDVLSRRHGGTEGRKNEIRTAIAERAVHPHQRL